MDTILNKYYNVDTQTLSLPWVFNKEIKNLLIDVQIIIFEEDRAKKQFSKFNQSVDNLPNTLTHINFGRRFNQSVDNLPNNLTHLTFGAWFNQSVDSLPNNLTHLTFGVGFNQSVDYLPKNLTHLTFGYSFNQKVDSLPSTLIEIGFYSHCKIKNNIPNSIEFLNIFFSVDDFYNEPIENIASNVKEIKINLVSKVHYLKKIPFGCKVVDKLGKEIFLEKSSCPAQKYNKTDFNK
jgi:hypothetical protein